jgi:HEAT repeat protein
MNFIRDYNLRNAMILQFLANVIGILCLTYLNLLFLSTYPKNLLPYLFIAQSGVTFFIIILITPLLSQSNKFYEFGIQIIVAIIIILGILALKLNSYWMPFIFCIILCFTGILTGAIATSITNSLFNIREFKKKAKWINLAGSFGSILCGLSIPLIIKQSGSQVLLYLLVVLIVISGLFLVSFKSNFCKKENEASKSAMSYSLYRNYLVYIILLVIAYTFTDYALKTKISAVYNKNDIGVFMGYFFAICNIVDAMSQVFLFDKFLNRFSTVSLFAVLPIYWVISALLVLFYPSLLTIALLTAGWEALHSSNTIGRNLILNILPIRIAKQANYKIKGIIIPVSTCFVSIIILLIIHYLKYSIIASIVIIASCFLIFWVSKIFRSYEQTLKSSIQLKRFDYSMIESDRIQQELLRKVVLTSLQSKDVDEVKIGMALLNTLETFFLPKVVVKLLKSDSSDLRIQSAQLIKKYDNKAAAPEIVEQLSVEKNLAVISWLLDCLASLKPTLAKEIMQKYLINPKLILRKETMDSTFRAETLDTTKKINNSLHEMILDKEAKTRSAAIKIISDFGIKGFQNELISLISDGDLEVSKQAMSAVASQKITKAIPFIVMQLEKQKMFIQTMKILIIFDAASVPELQRYVINCKKLRGKLAAIRVISLIPNVKAEEAFSKIMQIKDFLICFAIAKQSAYRALRQGLSNHFKKQIRLYIDNEITLITILKNISNNESVLFKKLEINSRIFLIKKRCLYWFAAYTSSEGILKIMHNILNMEESKGVMQAKAIELLDLNLKDRDLAQKFSLAFDSYNVNFKTGQKSLIETLDPWLSRVLSYNEQKAADKTMHIMEKVILLRSVKLFHQLTSETLVVIANECECKEMVEGDVIFTEGDPPTGLYVVVSGIINIIRDKKTIAELHRNDFFGELSLLDEAPRLATAKSKEDGVLLFLSKETFDDIINDLPEILKSVVQTILGYLRKHITEEKT